MESACVALRWESMEFEVEGCVWLVYGIGRCEYHIGGERLCEGLRESVYSLWLCRCKLELIRVKTTEYDLDFDVNEMGSYCSLDASSTWSHAVVSAGACLPHATKWRKFRRDGTGPVDWRLCGTT